jgi:hypothetical protein
MLGLSKATAAQLSEPQQPSNDNRHSGMRLWSAIADKRRIPE